MPVEHFGGQTAVDGGLIIMWAGALADVPDGWALCDGANGTPDFTGKFIKATPDNTTLVGGTGGADSYTLTESQLAQHTHGGTTDTTGSHTHSVKYPTSTKEYISGDYLREYVSDVGTFYESTTNGDHSHVPTIDGVGGGASISNLPKHYELAFLMKL